MGLLEVCVSELEDAAQEYVAARLANEAASADHWAAALARVDMAWHELLRLCSTETSHNISMLSP